MTKRMIESPHAPKAIGPYSQAVSAGGFLFVSGQIPLDPSSGELVVGGIDVQTRQVMENLRAILEAANATFEVVVKTTIYLTNLSDFATVNGIYGEYVKGSLPARATVQVSALPRGAAVEIDLVAHLGV